MSKRQAPKPVLNRRLLFWSLLLAVLCVGLVTGLAAPRGAVVFLAVVFFLVSAGLAADSWWIWSKEYRVWASKPVKPVRKLPPRVKGGAQ